MIRLFTIFSIVYYNKGSVYYTLPYYIHKLFLESHAFRSKISYVYGVQLVVCTNWFFYVRLSILSITLSLNIGLQWLTK